MNTQEIIDFIKYQMERGATRAEVEQVLKLNQVPAETVAKAFASITPPASPPPAPTPTVPLAAATEVVAPPQIPKMAPPVAAPAAAIKIPMPNLETIAPAPKVAPVAGSHWLAWTILVIVLLAGLGIGASVYLGYWNPFERLTPAPISLEEPPPVAPLVEPEIETIEEASTASSSVATSTDNSTATGTEPLNFLSQLSPDETVKETMAALQTAATTFAAKPPNNNYSGFCVHQETASLMEKIQQAGGQSVICNEGTIGKSYAASVKLSTGKFFCIDSAGAKKELEHSLIQGTGNTTCPAS